MKRGKKEAKSWDKERNYEQRLFPLPLKNLATLASLESGLRASPSEQSCQAGWQVPRN